MADVSQADEKRERSGRTLICREKRIGHVCETLGSQHCTADH